MSKIYLILLVGLLAIGGTLAQIDIPTATPQAPTQAALDALVAYAPDDIPDNFLDQSDEAAQTRDELLNQLAEDNPAIAVSSLGSLYQSYGVYGSYRARYFTESCEDQTVFGLSAWILGLNDPESITAFMDEPGFAELYEELFGWVAEPDLAEALENTETARTYIAPVREDICAEPSTEYVAEYPIPDGIAIARVYAPDTTDPALAAAVLDDLIGLIGGEATTETATERPTITFTVNTNVRRGPGLVFDPPIGNYDAGETVEILAVTPDGTWLKVPYNNVTGWVSAGIVEINGDTADLPRESGPMPPIPSPQPQSDDNTDDTGGRSDNVYTNPPDSPTAAAPTHPPQQPPMPTATPCEPPVCAEPPPFLTPTPEG